MEIDQTPHRWRATFTIAIAMFLCIFALLVFRLTTGEDPLASATTTTAEPEIQSQFEQDESEEFDNWSDSPDESSNTQAPSTQAS